MRSTRISAVRSTTYAYSWPVKPFERQHPVRAFLNDPRIGKKGTRAFHFGIDISAPDGTKVYAVEAGTVYIEYGMSLSVVATNAARTFGYWHIVPSVRNHQQVARHQVLGVIGRGWEHVHFAESRNGHYVNPLRPGALGPYADCTAPTVAGVAVTRDNAGGVTLVADAFDTPSPRVPGAWADEPVTPVLLRWRVVGAGATLRRWHNAVDFRSAMLSQEQFPQIYAPGTRQNHRGEPGRFVFYLVRRWTPTLADGEYALQVRASDTCGNAGQLVVRLTAADGTIAVGLPPE